MTSAPNWLTPGASVVCIDDDWPVGLLPGVPYRVPMLNEVLTIASVELHNWAVYLTFIEIPLHQTAGPIGADVAYYWEHFRPLVKRTIGDDMKIFAPLLDVTRVDEGVAHD